MEQKLQALETSLTAKINAIPGQTMFLFDPICTISSPVVSEQKHKSLRIGYIPKSGYIVTVKVRLY